MNKCSPVDMRKALANVEILRSSGIRFVPMPVCDDLEHDKMFLQMIAKLETMEQEAEEGKGDGS